MNWGEYIGQSDLSTELYEATTAVYELVDFLLENSSIEVPEKIQPFIERFINVVGEDVKRKRTYLSEF